MSSASSEHILEIMIVIFQQLGYLMLRLCARSRWVNLIALELATVQRNSFTQPCRIIRRVPDTGDN